MLGSSLKHKLRIIIPILLAMCIVISTVSVAIFSVLGKGKSTDEQNQSNSNGLNSNNQAIPVETDPVIVEKVPLTDYKSISITPGVDFLTGNETPEEAKQQLVTIVSTAQSDGFNTIELTLNYSGGLMFSQDLSANTDNQYLIYLSALIKKNGMKLISAVDLKTLAENHITDTADIEKISNILSHETIGKYSDMLILKNCYITSENIPEDQYNAAENENIDYEQYLKNRLDEAVKKYYYAAAKSRGNMAVGVEVNKEKHPENAIQNIKTWLSNGIIDFVDLYNPYSTTLKETNFKSYYESVLNDLGIDKSLLHCRLAYEKIGSKEKGWELTDQILRQLKELDALEVKSFTIDSYKLFVNDKTESRDAVKKYFADLIADDYILKELSVSKPTKTKFTTSDKTVLLMGASDPEFALTLNGETLERTELGFFSTDLELKDGLNTFKLEHKGSTKTYKITYKRIIIKEISPADKQTLPSRSILLVSCQALTGSTVTATLDKYSVTLSESPVFDANGHIVNEYSEYSGRIELPIVYDENKTLGKITFKATSKYGNETKQSGNIVVLKEDRPAPPSSSESTGSNSSSGSSGAPQGGEAWVMPSGGKYMDVGTTYVAEVVNWQAETFDAREDSDYSRPTNNYLPKGTVDYCSTGVTASSGGNMKTLRYGNMIYTTSSKGVKTLDVYQGTLPDHNTLNVANVDNTGRHTVITLDTLWKAPFLFDLSPQEYPKNGLWGKRDYTITSATFKYIDITFCYTTLVTGEVNIPENNPVFSKAEWIKTGSDYTIRLYLKKTGKFYGWSAEYNANNQLVFRFLNPVKIANANNFYGAKLDGTVIFIDVGHGGNDGGAEGSNKNYNEAVLNLILAKKLRAELESIGATVILSREDNTTNQSADDKMEMMRKYKPDFCISIHRNAAGSAAQGFMSYHFNAFSSDAAKMVYQKTEDAKLYKKDKWYGTKWHYYYMCRQTDCPVVLTENGFMTNKAEYSDMIKDEFNQKCAVALAQGIVDYFRSIQ